MNKVILMGRLTKDPEVRMTEKQMSIARYTIAIDRPKKGGESTGADFINCVAFDRAADFVEKYFRKGNRILITGHLQTGSYTNRDGVKVYTTDVIIESQEFVDSKSDTERREMAKLPSADSNGFMAIPDNVDDMGLPFN